MEFLIEGSPNAGKVTQRLIEKGRRKLAKELESEFPVAAAAQFSKRRINEIIKERQLDKWTRKALKRYFRRCRDAVHGKYRFKTKTYRRSGKARETRYTYAEYINSLAWASRRNRYWQEHPRICTVCETHSFIELHHMIYTAFDGTEPDENLVALCKPHHQAYHRQHGSSGNMLVTTIQFIDQSKPADRSYPHLAVCERAIIYVCTSGIL